MKIRKLCRKSHKIAVEKGWWDEPRTIPEALCLVHSEVSEALEEFRDGHQPCDIRFVTKDDPSNPKPEGFPVEIADAFIRLADLCEAYEITADVEDAIRIKMAYNKTRPHRHGGKAC